MIDACRRPARGRLATSNRSSRSRPRSAARYPAVMDLAERPERPRPAGWVIAAFTDDGKLQSRLHADGYVWDDEAEAAGVVEKEDSPHRPLALYALVPAWGPVEEPTATVEAP